MAEKPTYEALFNRVKFLEQSVSELEHICQAERRAIKLLNAIRKAQSLYIADSEPPEIYKLLLETLVEISESEYGFLDEVSHDANGRIFKKNLAISNISWDETSKSLYKKLQDRHLTFSYLDNLAGLPALTGKTIISNDPSSDSRSKGLPEGHPAIKTFMGIPLYFGGKLICIAGLANRKSGYNEETAVFLNPLLSVCGGITYALQKERIEKEKDIKLRESEERYRLIIESQNELIVKFDQDHKILFVSPSCCKTFGVEEEKITGNSFFSLIHEDDIETVKASLETLKEPPHIAYHEERAKTVEGWRWFGWSLKAVVDDDARIVIVVSVGRDITNRKRAEAALEKSEKRFRTVADFTYDWEYWAAPDGRYTYVSPSCKRITGYDPDDFIKNPDLMKQIIHPEDLAMVMKHGQADDESDAPHLIDFRIIAKAGDERWISHICRAVYDDADGRFLGRRGSNRDITERKRLQRASMKAHQMQAIGTLAGGVAHQFNNALTVIGGNLELLEIDFSGNKAVGDYVLAMKASAERMKRLTAQLLAYARGGKYQARTVSFVDFVADAIPIIHHAIGQGVAIDADLPDDDLSVKIDQTQMQMVLSCILSNASEAMDGNGCISVSCRRFSGGEDIAEELPELKPGDYACLTIADEGRGMDEETRSRVFEPFFTTKFQGRGLGMAAAYGIVKNHGGFISVASESGKGATVSIYLPLVETSPESI